MEQNGKNIIRVGIIGAGKNTLSKHIPLLQKIPGVHVVSVANRSMASSERVCQQFNIPHATDDPMTILNDSKIDAIVVGTWPYKHKEFGCEALKQGKHVMVEARISMNGKEAEEMLKVSKQYPKLVTQVVPAPFTLTYDHVVVAHVKEKIGKLINVEVNVNFGSFPDYESPLTWRQDVKTSGNNIMMLGIYYEILLRWVPAAATVFANGSVVVSNKSDPEAPDRVVSVVIPDLITVTGRLRCGSHYTIKMSNTCGLNKTNEVVICGNEGTLKVDVDNQQISFGKRGGDLLETVAYEKGKHWRVEEEFIGAIRGEEKIRYTTWEDGVVYMKFMDAVWESMQSGRLITLL